MRGPRSNDVQHVQIRDVPFDECCSRVRVFELAVLLSSLRDSCWLGVRERKRGRQNEQKKNRLDERLERGTIIAA